MDVYNPRDPAAITVRVTSFGGGVRRASRWADGPLAVVWYNPLSPPPPVGDEGASPSTSSTPRIATWFRGPLEGRPRRRCA